MKKWYIVDVSSKKKMLFKKMLIKSPYEFC